MNALSLKTIKNDYPRCHKAIVASKRNLNYDIHGVLDSFFSDYGLTVLVKLVYSYDDEVVLGHKSAMKIYPLNKLNRMSDEIELVDDNFRKFKSHTKALNLATNYTLNFLEDQLAWK